MANMIAETSLATERDEAFHEAIGLIRLGAESQRVAAKRYLARSEHYAKHMSAHARSVRMAAVLEAARTHIVVLEATRDGGSRPVQDMRDA